MERWLWLCPPIGLLGAGAALWLYGFSLLSALGIAFLISCPAVVFWTVREYRIAFAVRDRLADELAQGKRPMNSH